MKFIFPRSQRELIRCARGGKSQRSFAGELGVGPSSMSRYESEQLGAPVSVITRCLQIVGHQFSGKEAVMSPTEAALFHARSAVSAIEQVVPKQRGGKAPGQWAAAKGSRKGLSRPYKSNY